jgi:hypothetical protein
VAIDRRIRAMMDIDARPARIAELRKAVLDRCAAMLDAQLPASGEPGTWKPGEMELALLEDVRVRLEMVVPTTAWHDNATSATEDTEDVRLWSGSVDSASFLWTLPF